MKTQPDPSVPPTPPAGARWYDGVRTLFSAGYRRGTVLLWMSRKFLVWEKVLMTAVVPGGPFLFLGLAFLVGGQSCSSTSTTDAVGNPVELPPTCSGFAFAPWAGIPLFVLVICSFTVAYS